MNWLPKKCLFSYLRFLNVYILSLVLILNRENLDGEPGNNCYDILKFWPILSLVILIKRILIRNGVLHSANNRNMVQHTIIVQRPLKKALYVIGRSLIACRAIVRRGILKVVLYFPLTYSKARRSVMLSKKTTVFRLSAQTSKSKQTPKQYTLLFL